MSRIIKSSYVIIQNPQKENDSTKYVKHVDESVNDKNYVVEEAYEEKQKILNEALEEAKAIVNSANEYKKSVLASMIREMEEHRKKGFEIGHTIGYEQGKQQGFSEGEIIAQKEIDDKNEGLVAELCKQIYTVEESKDEIIKKYEKDIVKLSIDIAEKIIQTSIDKNDDIIKCIINNAIKDYRNVEWVKIYLSSNNYITISTDKSLMQKLSRICERVILEVVTDASDGDLIIETPENLIDSGVNTQLSNLRDIVIGTWYTANVVQLT